MKLEIKLKDPKEDRLTKYLKECRKAWMKWQKPSPTYLFVHPDRLEETKKILGTEDNGL